MVITRTSLSLVRTLCGGLSLMMAAGCVEQAEEKPTAEDLDFIKKNVLTSASPKFAANADLDGKVVYLGLDADPLPIEPGRDVKLTHYWKVVEPTGDGWRLFVHANGPNKQGFVNFDHGPVRGKYPVTQWKAGEIVRDEHIIRLPANWAHDKVEIYVGLWKRQERMAIKSGNKDADGRVLAATLPVSAKAPVVAKSRYTARKVAKAPKLDGVLDEQAWKDAPSTGAFVNTLTGAAVTQKTEAKLLWDKDNLYIAAELQDSDVWGNFSKRDDKLWQEEAFELMVDANGDGKSYVEFQVSPKGLVFDTYLPTYRKYEDSIDPAKKPYSWDSKIKTAVKVDGTLNKREDSDKGWVVEIAIPLADLNGMAKEGEGAVKVPPAFGDVWHVNMFRLDVAKSGAQEASGWSAPLVGDFHKLDRFGEVVFADEKGVVPPPPVAKGAEAPAKKMTPEERKAAVKQALTGLPGSKGMAPGSEPAEGALVLPTKDKKSAASVKGEPKK